MARSATGVPSPLAVVGILTGPRGLKGEAWIRSFTADPADLVAYGPVQDAGGRIFALQVLSVDKDRVLVRIEGVADREGVEALKGTQLYVPKSAFGELEDEEFFQADLVGLAAEAIGGRPLGKVVAVQDFGAGVLLEVGGPEGPSILVPFTKAVVPTVDIAGGKVIIDPPPGLLETDES